MYSIVLATMLTTGTATPAFGFHGCHGCHGCWGCRGCYGGCYGCCGGCWGCCGGCWGCCGGCYGGWYSSCYGCCGGCWGCCGGCYGSCYGAAVIVQPVVATAPAPLPAPVKTNKATVLLRAPTDARVTVNGQLLTRTQGEETFASPALRPGNTYSYIFKAEATRDGKTVTRTKRVSVQANRPSRVDFSDLGPAPADGPAHLTVRLPAEARLLVDGQVCPLTSATRSFDTPRLKGGQTYYYTLKAEIEREGRTQSATRRVLVTAGKKVEVEFKDLMTTQAARR